MTDGKVNVMLLISDLEFGGAQRQVLEIANNLDPARFNVYVGTLSSYVPLADQLHDADTRLRVIEKRWKFDLTVLLRLARLLKSLKIDIINSFLFDALIAGRLAGRLAGTPVIVDSERNADYRIKRIQRVAYWLTKRCVDRVIANSQAGADFNARELHQNPAMYRVVHNGVNTQRFSPRDARAMRESLNIAPDEQVVGMFASFWRQKNHPALIAAARKVLDLRPRTRFMLVGDELYAGMHGTSEYKQRMNEQIDELGVRDRFLFLGNRPDVAELYGVCDVTVLPSLNEGTPNVLLESMASGVPVVVTDVADNAYIVPEGKVGFVVPVNDVDALADRLLQVIGNNELRSRMKTEARRWIEAEFSTQRLAEKTAKVFVEALQDRRVD